MDNEEKNTPSPEEQQDSQAEQSESQVDQSESPVESLDLDVPAVPAGSSNESPQAESQSDENAPAAEQTAQTPEDAAAATELEGTPALEVEGGLRIFFKPKNIYTHLIEFHPEEWDTDPDTGKKVLLIGRRSTEDGIYPDIDLWKFFFNDGDEYISRRHVHIIADEGKFYLQDISGKGSTWVNGKADENRLVRTETDEAKHLLNPGDRLFISDSLVFRYIILPPQTEEV